MHGDILTGYDAADVRRLADVQRFLERYRGDPGFRRAGGEEAAARAELLSRLGIGTDAQEWEPVWRLCREEPHRLTQEDVASSRLLGLWAEWQRALAAQGSRLGREWAPPLGSRFGAWRHRQIQRYVSEVGPHARRVLAPVVAYELSRGCSIGCWFCGASAGPLEGFAPHAESANLWRELLSIGLEVFGEGAKLAICFHGTEPFDNPDYLEFVKDFRAVVGVVPQTTTAVPLRNLELTRELMWLRESCPVLPDRFSVLSIGTLDEIHRTFSPYDLRYVELVLQNPGALLYKADSGRAREHPERLKSFNESVRRYDPVAEVLDPLTNQCVCGYLVNLLDRTVKLVSPCNATGRWPNGYQVHEEGTFRDAAEYRGFLDRTMEEMMPMEPAWEAKLSFRRDLEFQPQDDGFALTSRSYRHALKGKRWYGALGSLVDRGDATRGEVIARIASEGVPFPEVAAVIQRIFEKGLLQDERDVSHDRNPALEGDAGQSRAQAASGRG